MRGVLAPCSRAPALLLGDCFLHCAVPCCSVLLLTALFCCCSSTAVAVTFGARYCEAGCTCYAFPPVVCSCAPSSTNWAPGAHATAPAGQLLLCFERQEELTCGVPSAHAQLAPLSPPAPASRRTPPKHPLRLPQRLPGTPPGPPRHAPQQPGRWPAPVQPRSPPGLLPPQRKQNRPR